MPFPHKAFDSALLAYLLFLLWASLHPFSGWTLPPHSENWSFLFAPLPRWITRTDLATNLLVYVPLGYLLARRLAPRRTFLTMIACALISLIMESLQQWQPGRNASNVDIAINALGGLAGATLALHHHRLLRMLHHLSNKRAAWFKSGTLFNWGLWLLALWALAQFSLRPLPGIGWLALHLRPLDIDPHLGQAISPSWFAANLLEMLALGSFCTVLLRPGRYISALTLLFPFAFLSKLMAAAVLLRLSVIGGVLSLETLAAFFCAYWLLLLPAVSRHRLFVCLLSLVAILLWRMFEASSLGQLLWPKTNLLNLVGLAATAAAWWPLLALGVAGSIGWLRLGAFRR
jgi:VanZ family protein